MFVKASGLVGSSGKGPGAGREPGAHTDAKGEQNTGPSQGPRHGGSIPLLEYMVLPHLPQPYHMHPLQCPLSTDTLATCSCCCHQGMLPLRDADTKHCHPQHTHLPPQHAASSATGPGANTKPGMTLSRHDSQQEHRAASPRPGKGCPRGSPCPQALALDNGCYRHPVPITPHHCSAPALMQRWLSLSPCLPLLFFPQPPPHSLLSGINSRSD